MNTSLVRLQDCPLYQMFWWRHIRGIEPTLESYLWLLFRPPIRVRGIKVNTEDWRGIEAS